MTSFAAGRPQAGLVEAAAKGVLEQGLVAGGSAFTPGRSVWVEEAADDLDRCYVQRIDTGSGTFLEKLKTQLSGAAPQAVQLCAELLYLNVLPLVNVSGLMKRQRINTVLGWLPDLVSIPAQLDEALDSGVFNGGVGFNTRLWEQLILLIRVTQAGCRLSPQERQRILGDPWEWKTFVEQVRGPSSPSQRNALKYLAFPAAFQPIVSDAHRKQIRDYYGQLIDGQPSDVDRDLLAISSKLREQSPDKPLDFYQPPWAGWLAKKVTPGQHAWLVRAPSPEVLDEWQSAGFVSLPASRLRELSPGVDLPQVQQAVSEDYSSHEYVRQLALAAGFHHFLTSMRPEDVLVAQHEDNLLLGTLSPGEPWFDEHGPQARLRRRVNWRPDQRLPAVADLPQPLPAHLAAQGTVVDLSEDLDALRALLSDTDDDASPGEAEATMVGRPPLPKPTDDLADRLHIDRAYLQEWVNLLEDRQQVIFFGPPGTGKTFVAERLARFLAQAGTRETERVLLVQFHPSTSYEDFVEGYRPSGTTESGQLQFQLTPGPLIRISSAARQDPSRPYFLVIDEINRANLAAVFGELYYLLEYRNNSIRLLYRPDRPYVLPENLFVIGTMNTADRSIALVDAAMRRRFAFVELHPDDEPVRGMLRRWLDAQRKPSRRADLLEALNARIDDRDFKIGPSYLMKPDADRSSGLEGVWKYSILPLLIEHHYGRLTPAQVERRFGLSSLLAELSPASASPAGPTAGGPPSPPPGPQVEGTGMPTTG